MKDIWHRTLRTDADQKCLCILTLYVHIIFYIYFVAANLLIQVSQVINLPQISQISQILAAHCHAIAQIFYGLLRLKSLINRRIQSVKSKIIVAIATLICLIC